MANRPAKLPDAVWLTRLDPLPAVTPGASAIVLTPIVVEQLRQGAAYAVQVEEYELQLFFVERAEPEDPKEFTEAYCPDLPDVAGDPQIVCSHAGGGVSVQVGEWSLSFCDDCGRVSRRRLRRCLLCGHIECPCCDGYCDVQVDVVTGAIADCDAGSEQETEMCPCTCEYSEGPFPSSAWFDWSDAFQRWPEHNFGLCELLRWLRGRP